MAGVELIFPIVAGLGLCFGSVLETFDFTGVFSLLMSSAYTELSSVPEFTLPVRRLRMHKELGDTQQGQLTSIDPRALPYHIASCLAINLGRRSRKGGCLK